VSKLLLRYLHEAWRVWGKFGPDFTVVKFSGSVVWMRRLVRHAHASGHASQLPAASCRYRLVQQVGDGLPDSCAVADVLRPVFSARRSQVTASACVRLSLASPGRHRRGTGLCGSGRQASALPPRRPFPERHRRFRQDLGAQGCLGVCFEGVGCPLDHSSLRSHGRSLGRAQMRVRSAFACCTGVIEQRRGLLGA